MINKIRKPLSAIQKQRQAKLARARWDKMTPAQKVKYYARKDATRVKWLERNPEMQERINRRAREKRKSWSPERLQRQKSTQKSHYKKCQLRVEHGLCAYSVNCNETPVGKQKFCLRHWLRGIRQADLRLAPQYSESELMDLWVKQGGKCAITNVVIVPGETATLDHIVPVARGGGSTIDNIRFIHWVVNRTKWDLTDDEFKTCISEICLPLAEWAKNTT